jgi:hypothetical protein
MAVLIRHRLEGFTIADYDKVSPPLLDLIKQQPGFVFHLAFEDSQGACVSEIWEAS